MTATKKYHAKKDIVKLAIQVQSKTSFTFPSNVQVTITSDHRYLILYTLDSASLLVKLKPRIFQRLPPFQ